MLLLLSCWIIAASSAEAPPKLHYRVKNSSLCLQVKNSPPRKDLVWAVNKTIIVLDKVVTANYTDKVDYNPGDVSLCVNKLTERDSGTYEVSVVDGSTVSTETHILSVEEPVSTPVIRMSVIRSNLTAGFCNITVNCSIQDDWAWAVCDEDGCKSPQRSFSEVTITISAQNRTVVCTGSNHVSTSNVSESIEETCFNESNHEQDMRSKTSISFIIIVAVTVAVCVAACIFIICVTKRRCSRQHNKHQTSPAPIIQSQSVGAQPQPAPRASTSSSLSEAEAAYENVDGVQPSHTSSLREDPGSQQSPPVDTVYSFLQATNATASGGNGQSSKDAKGPVTTHEASNSQAEQPAQIDTVYTVLQKPKNKQTKQDI